MSKRSGLLPRTMQSFTSFCSQPRPFIPFVVIVLLGSLSYSNTLHVPRQFDDDAAVRISASGTTELFTIANLLGNRRWLVDVTFALNRALHGEQVPGFHICNLFIHLATAFLVYLLVKQLINQLAIAGKAPDVASTDTALRQFIPLATAALFVSHPIQTQAVTYIIQRYTSLATLLYTAALLGYLKFRAAYDHPPSAYSRAGWGIFTLVTALLAMKCKEIAFTLPLTVALLELFFFRGALLKNKTILLIGSALLLLIPLQLLYSQSTGGNFITHLHLATAETTQISRSDYLLTQFRVIVTYLRLLIVPVQQNLDYDYPLFHSLAEPEIAAALALHLLLAAAAGVCFFLSRRQFLSTNPASGIPLRLVSFGILWFYLTLTVESTVIPIRDVIYEHRLYLPSIGFFIAITAILTMLMQRRTQLRVPILAATALMCVVLSAASFARNRIWASDLSLWLDVLAKSPHKARPLHAVGELYFRRFQPEQALPKLIRAIELDPGSDRYRITLNAQIATLAASKSRSSDGEKYQSSLVTVAPRFHRLWLAISHNNLGLAYELQGNLYLARQQYQKALEINPALDLAWYNLALVAALQGDDLTARSACETLRTLNHCLASEADRAIEKNPAQAGVHR